MKIYNNLNMESVRNLDYGDIFKEQITPYQRFDIQKVKANANVKNARELEKEGKNIAEMLKDVKSKFKVNANVAVENDWSKRLKAI